MSLGYTKYSPKEWEECQESFETQPMLSMKSLQLYLPIYRLFFNLSPHSSQSMTLNQRYQLLRVTDSMYTPEDKEYYKVGGANRFKICIWDRKTSTTHHVQSFFKFSPLMDPAKYVVGKYKNLQERTPYDIYRMPTWYDGPREKQAVDEKTSRKIDSPHNTSYVDSFFSYLTSMAKHDHGMVHGIDYFGSFLGVHPKFPFNAFDDIEYVSESTYFHENRVMMDEGGLDNHPEALFEVEPIMYEFMEEDSRKHRRPLKFVEDRADPAQASHGNDGTQTNPDALLECDELDESLLEQVFVDSGAKANASHAPSGIVDTPHEQSQPFELLWEEESNHAQNDKDDQDAQEPQDEPDQEDQEDTQQTKEGQEDQEGQEDAMDSLEHDSTFSIESSDTEDSELSESDESDHEEDQNSQNSQTSQDGSEEEDSAESAESEDDKSGASGEDDESGEDSEDDEDSILGEDEHVWIHIRDFPVDVICLESMEGTLDALIEQDELDTNEWISCLAQIVLQLVAYQTMFGFTHNDLHTNNIMYVHTDKKYLFYKVGGKHYRVPTFGRLYKLIDFGRAIYTYRGVRICSDSYHRRGDAANQYNTEPYYDPSKPRIEPNPAFDLVRLGCSLYDFFIDHPKEEAKYVAPLERMILDWCRDDSGKNVLYTSNGEERYPGFSLYKHIARDCSKQEPRAQFIQQRVFQSMIIGKKKIPKKAVVMNVDELPNYQILA